MKLHVTKTQLGHLVPADRESKEALQKIEAGEYLTADIKRPRNERYHRLFFALLTMVHDNLTDEQQDKWPTVERLLIEIKLQTGYFDMAESVTGKMYPITKSISFAAMDDGEFDQFFGKAISVVCRYILPGVTDAQLREALDQELSQYA